MLNQKNYVYTAQSRQSAKRFSSRWNWDSPTPLAAGECASVPPHPLVRGGGRAHSLGAKGVGESQFQRGNIHCGALYILSTLWYTAYRECSSQLPRIAMNIMEQGKSRNPFSQFPVCTEHRGRSLLNVIFPRLGVIKLVFLS
jgi:hypothetical protein